jgi:hypothetical protein
MLHQISPGLLTLMALLTCTSPMKKQIYGIALKHAIISIQFFYFIMFGREIKQGEDNGLNSENDIYLDL